MLATKRLAAVMVLLEQNLTLGQTDMYSPDTVNPGCLVNQYQPDCAYQWNPSGSGLLFNSFDIPIFGLLENDTTTSSIMEVSRKDGTR